MTPQDFVLKWKKSALTERQAAQSHWNDICRLIGQPTPTDHDPTGETYCFERGAHKTSGGDGWADVWFKGRFAVEYKRKKKDLDKAYQQLLQYREDLGNPPLLMVIDLNRFEVHTNFTGTAKRVFRFSLDDIAKGEPVECVCNEATPPRLTGVEVLRLAFTNPGALKPTLTAEYVTAEASSGIAKIAESMRNRGVEPHQAAHFLMKVLFCLFAEDIGLLPESVFSRIVKNARGDSDRLLRSMTELFAAMKDGGDFGADDIPWFNGGLFDGTGAIEMTEGEIDDLKAASRLDWSQVEPSIFGTLFERSLDPAQRAQLGAHYTGRDDIMLVVEPVVLRPMLRLWDQAREQAKPPVEKARKALEALERLKAGDAERKKHEKALRAARAKVEDIYGELLHQFHGIRILDPACGSGNFLYVALNELKNIEKQIIHEVAGYALGTTRLMPVVEPSQLYGIEINPYAHELAQVVVWIGYIQWYMRNGYEVKKDPVLKPLNNIKHMDALLERSAGVPPAQAVAVPATAQEAGAVETTAPGAAGTAALRAKRPEWPEADFIIGNPPFLGGKLLRRTLGDEYVDALFKAYDGEVAREADLSVYWHERARALIEEGKVKRAGLLATQGIRGGANQRTLKHILETGNIFEAWSDKKWVLAGAAVHVSIVCQDAGIESNRRLDGRPLRQIHADLSGGSTSDLTSATRLNENAGLSFMGDTKGGAFDVPPEVAKSMLRKPNPNGLSNADVIVPWVNGMDITRRPRGFWIVDFGEMDVEDAARYEAPFEHVREHVKPLREKNKRDSYRTRWWIHVEPRPAMREALKLHRRFVGTPTVAKFRLFSWLEAPTLPDHQLIVFAREDDYFFGVLHSVAHERWALGLGTQLEDRPRYTPTTSFETFPFPWPPGKEPAGDARVQAIADAARELNQLRENWLNPPGEDEAALKKRTLTNLYNQRPEWLHFAHLKLDRAVFAAYGWDLDPENLYAALRPQPGETPQQATERQKQAEEKMLKHLLALNHERAFTQGS